MAFSHAVRQAVARLLDIGHHRVLLALPYSEAGRLEILYRDARVEKVEYTDDCILINATVDSRLYGWARQFVREVEFPDTI